MGLLVSAEAVIRPSYGCSSAGHVVQSQGLLKAAPKLSDYKGRQSESTFMTAFQKLGPVSSVTESWPVSNHQNGTPLHASLSFYESTSTIGHCSCIRSTTIEPILSGVDHPLLTSEANQLLQKQHQVL